MVTLENIQDQLDSLKQRNAKVEIDKAWETSKTRRGLLMLFTYLAIGCYMWAIDINRPWINAIVPTVGFLLSTLSLPLFKTIWINTHNKQKI